MTTELEVLEFVESRMLSKCRVVYTDGNMCSIGDRVYVDLTVNADLGEMPERELVGKTVIVEELRPCEYIGVRVKIKD